MWAISYGSLTIEFASVIDKLRAVVLRAYDSIILFEFTCRRRGSTALCRE